MPATGRPAKLDLTVDRPRVFDEPSDVAHVTVKVLDQEGRVVPTALQPTGVAGTLTLSASCPALSPGQVDIEVG
jgi:hypothetical protein